MVLQSAVTCGWDHLQKSGLAVPIHVLQLEHECRLSIANNCHYTRAMGPRYSWIVRLDPPTDEHHPPWSHLTSTMASAMTCSLRPRARRLTPRNGGPARSQHCSVCTARRRVAGVALGLWWRKKSTPPGSSLFLPLTVLCRVVLGPRDHISCTKGSHRRVHQTTGTVTAGTWVNLDSSRTKSLIIYLIG